MLDLVRHDWVERHVWQLRPWYQRLVLWTLGQRPW